MSHQASMGPRHLSRGNLAGRSGPTPGNSLQWGHGISAVEIIDLTRKTTREHQLQWGHGISAVEIAGTLEFIRPKERLQWGHGISAVEICSRRMPWRFPSRFNGATASQPWKWFSRKHPFFFIFSLIIRAPAALHDTVSLSNNVVHLLSERTATHSCIYHRASASGYSAAIGPLARCGRESDHTTCA